MATKKPSAAQIAARKAFAERARSGAFKRTNTRRKAGKIRPSVFERGGQFFAGRQAHHGGKWESLDYGATPFKTKGAAFKAAKESVQSDAKKYGRPERVAPYKAPVVKRKVKKAPSPAQLAARKKFVEMVRAKAKAKGTKKNSRGFSSKAPAWTKLPNKRRKSRKRNPIRMSEAEAKRYAPKIKGLSLVSGKSAAPKKRKAARFKKPAKRALARAFSGSGLFGLGRSRKKIRARNPHGQHLPGLPAKYQRMYEDILTSSGSKRIAAATTMKTLKRDNPKWFNILSSDTRTKRGTTRKKWKARRISPSFDLTQRGGGHKAARRRGHKRTLGGGPRSYQWFERYRPHLPNPSPASVFSEFRGKDATRSVKLKGHGTGKLTVAQLGELRELKLPGKKLEFGGSARLCADGRKKLHIAGVKLKVKGNADGEVDMGPVHSVTYRSDKPHIEQGVLDYVHRFGEDGGKCPHLIVDIEGYPYFEGGSYKIDADGIIN